MTITDFKIGDKFWFGREEWVCVDIATRTILAHKVVDSEGDQIFDEYDMGRSDKTRRDSIERNAPTRETLQSLADLTPQRDPWLDESEDWK